MPASYDYAERLCRRLQEERENVGMSRYALEKRSGVSRDIIGDIEHGDSIPTLHLAGQLVPSCAKGNVVLVHSSQMVSLGCGIHRMA